MKKVIINLSQGFPDFDPPREITDRLAEIAPSGPHQYAITWGAQNFREALAKKTEPIHGTVHRPRQEHCGDLWLHRGHDGCDDDGGESAS